MLSNEEAVSHIRHALHGPLDSELEELAIYNQAGRHLSDMHTWKYLERPEASLDTTISQAYIPLPTDFGSEIVADADENLVSTMKPTTFAHLMKLRNESVQARTNYYYYAVEWAAQASANVELVPRFALWPTPTVSEVGIFALRYRATWVNQVALDTGVVQVPDYCQNLFIAVLRACAQGYVDEDLSKGITVGSLYAALEGDPRFLNAVARDGSIQSSYGPLRNGAVGAGDLLIDWGLHATIADPS